MNSQFLNIANRLKAIADTGLLYSTDEYDRERYSDIKELGLELFSLISGNPIERLREYFPLIKDYPTAKVDIRGMLLSPDGKILMVKERADGRWSLPGGWADIGYSPKEAIIKEFREETGLDIVPKKLLAVFDKKMHNHPPQQFYIYKMIFYCETIAGSLNKGFDISDVQYFEVGNLPLLSEDRILASQIEMLYRKIYSSDFNPLFD